jgi:hypothetical protein
MMAKVKVYSYPRNSGVSKHTIITIQKLLDDLCKEIPQLKTVEVVDGDSSFGEYSQFLNGFLCDCKGKRGYVDIQWLLVIQTIIISSVSVGIWEDYEFLRPHLDKASKKDDWKEACNGQFLSLRSLSLKKGQGPWGASVGIYPKSTTVETTGYPESIWHEFLHPFGVSDGYDENTKETLPGCEDCWMQYNSTRGKGLCRDHLYELKGFFEEARSLGNGKR